MNRYDFMIGDLVTFKDCLEEDRIIPIRITAIRDCDNHFLAQIDGDDISDELEFDDEIVGIPLTPEILEKNGFKPGIISWILWDEETDECLIMLKRINNAFIFPPLAGMSFGIQYIHELQHLFRLGGIKKQIVI